MNTLPPVSWLTRDKLVEPTMPTGPDKALLDEADDRCGSKRRNPISTFAQSKSDSGCKSEKTEMWNGPTDVVTDTCCSGDGKGNSPVLQESGCCRSSCAAEAFKQTKDQLCGSMTGDTPRGEVPEMENTAVVDTPTSAARYCCDGMVVF